MNTAIAQTPAWSVNPAGFSNNMSLTAQVFLDGNEENGANNLLAAFVGNEVRGIASPLMVGTKAYYFLTVHSNLVVGETVEFKVFLQGPGTVHPALEEIAFLKSSQIGNYPDGFAVNISLANDFPIDLFPFLPDSTLAGFPFNGIDLNGKLLTQDNDPVLWSIANGVNLSGSVGAGNVLTVTPTNPNWTGTDSVMVTATETGTAIAFSASKYAKFTIEPDYGMPIFGELPVQFVQGGLPLPSGDFSGILDFDGPCVEFSVELVVPEGTEAMPMWTQPTSNSGSMSLVVQADFGGNLLSGAGNKLAAFVNGIFAGVASPQTVLGKELYFLTLANVGKGEIVLKLYDAGHQYLLEKATGANFFPASSLGDFNSPIIVDFAPMLVNLSSDGSWTTTVFDTYWPGELRAIVSATDCKYGDKVASLELVFLLNLCPSMVLTLPDGAGLCFEADGGVSEVTWFLDGNEVENGQFFGAFEPGIYHYEGVTPLGCPDVKSCPIVVIEGPDLNLPPTGKVKKMEEKSLLPPCGQILLTEINIGNVPPTANCKSATVFLDNNGYAPLNTIDVDNGSFSSCGDAVVSLSQEGFDCLNVGVNTVVLTIGDAAGRTASCTAVVTVEDNIAPSVTCKNRTANLNANGSKTIQPSFVFQSGSDNCGTVNLASVSPNSFNCTNLGPNTVTLTVNDGHGNTNTCTSTVTLMDNMKPSVTCKNHTVGLNASGSAAIIPENVFQSGSDNCGTVNLISVSPNSFNCNSLGPNTVTLTVNDGHGNSKTCTATVTVQDTEIPVPICPASISDVLLGVDGNGALPANIGDGSSTDNCGVTETSPASSFTCADVGIQTVTLTASDGTNTSSTACTFNVVDNVAPAANCTAQPIIADLDANGGYSINPNDLNDGSSDACGPLAFAASPSTLSCQNEGPNPVTLTVTDSNGNSSTCTAIVNISPFITVTSAVHTDESCVGAGDGTVTVAATAGGGQVKYSIDGGVNFSSSGNFINLVPGAYSVIIKVFGIPAVCEKTVLATVDAGGSAQNWYKDIDNDGYSDGITLVSCMQPTGYKAFVDLAGPETDCNDNDPNAFPSQTWYKDTDGDNYTNGTTLMACLRPSGYKTAAELVNITDIDCNDSNVAINPGATEVCNGIDDNCNGQIDEGTSGGLTYTGNVTFSTQVALDDWSPCYSIIDGNVTITGGNVHDLDPLVNLIIITGNLTIQSTDITKMEGLDNLDSLGSTLSIVFNSKLKSLEGLDSLSTVSGSLYMYYNFKLDECCAIYNLLDTSGVAGSVVIYYNKVGCNSIAEINSECAPPAPPPLIVGPTIGTTHGQSINVKEMTVFPNPAKGEFTVAIPDHFEEGELQVMDITGWPVLGMALAPGQTAYQLDSGQLSAGIYLVCVKILGQPRQVIRLVVE